MNSHTSQLLIAIVIAIAITGCSGGTKDQIVGKWRVPEDGGQIEFLSDGTMIMTSGMMNQSVKYSFMDDGRLRIDGPSMFGASQTLIVQVAIDGDTLTFTNPDGRKVTRTRIR